MRKNLQTEDSRRFWAGVERTAWRVRQWPAWKRGEDTPPTDDASGYEVTQSICRIFTVLKVLS